MIFLVLADQTDKRRLLSQNRTLLFSMFNISKSESFSILNIIATMILMRLCVSIPIFLSEPLMLLMRYGDVVIMIFMLKLYSIGELMMLVDPRFMMMRLIVVLLVFLIFKFIYLLMRNQRLVTVLRLDHPQLALLISHQFEFIITIY